MEGNLTNYIFHFLAFYGAGLAVNLTPCVYPMLTVTVSLFRQKDSDGQRVAHSFRKALVYVLGLAVMYSSLGLLAAMTGTLFGGILQNKWVVLTTAFLMFALAFSMFGFYQFQVPSKLLGKLADLRKTNYWGLFFSGMFVGIFAAPCIGPPVLALLASVASKGNLLFGFSSFFVFSIGLGTPYLLLGTFSGLLEKLPKGGSWLIWVEHLFGVILLGFGFLYLAIALKPDLVKLVFPMTLIGGGIYLGFLRHSGKEHLLFVRFRWLMGIIAFIAGISLISSSIHPEGTDKLVWEPYEVTKLEFAKKQHKPVVIDFYADWCITCHELEANVFNNPTVAKELSKFSRLRVDATNMDAPDTQKILKQYGIFGLPIVVFIDGEGHEVEDARVIGDVSPEEFLKSLEITLKEISQAF